MYSGSDGILLGAETLRGLYPIETISIVGKICAEVNYHLNVSIRLCCLIRFVVNCKKLILFSLGQC